MLSQKTRIKIAKRCIGFFGTQLFFYKKTKHFHCIDCGSQINWKWIWRRNWDYTVCPICEGYMHVMIHGPVWLDPNNLYGDAEWL